MRQAWSLQPPHSLSPFPHPALVAITLPAFMFFEYQGERCQGTIIFRTVSVFNPLVIDLQVKLFAELFSSLFNSVIFTVLKADTKESLAAATQQFDNNLKVSCWLRAQDFFFSDILKFTCTIHVPRGMTMLCASSKRQQMLCGGM